MHSSLLMIWYLFLLNTTALHCYWCPIIYGSHLQNQIFDSWKWLEFNHTCEKQCFHWESFRNKLLGDIGSSVKTLLEQFRILVYNQRVENAITSTLNIFKSTWGDRNTSCCLATSVTKPTGLINWHMNCYIFLFSSASQVLENHNKLHRVGYLRVGSDICFADLCLQGTLQAWSCSIFLVFCVAQSCPLFQKVMYNECYKDNNHIQMWLMFFSGELG